MQLIEVPESRGELAAELQKTGASVTEHREDRYFGDANTVVLALEISNSLLSILATALTLWSAEKQVVIKVNGVEYLSSKSATEVDKKNITQALTQ